MIETQKKLLAVFCSQIVCAVIVSILFETSLLPDGLAAGIGGNIEFGVTSAMQIVTLCAIPVSLRLFKFGIIKRQLTTEHELGKWSMARILILSDLMIANTLLYYLFLNASFGYMAIILLLCMFFVVPTKERWMTDNEKYVTADTKEN